MVHGVVVLNDLPLFQQVLRTMKPDQNFPWLRADMFNVGPTTLPYYYQRPVVTFGTSYKNLDGGSNWSEFILKFEYLLAKLDFDYARIRLETECFGDYEFFWGQKTGAPASFYGNTDLIERDRWFFGYGCRHMFGSLLHEEVPELPYDFQYPIAFDEDAKRSFNEAIPKLNQLTIGTQQYIKDALHHRVLGNGYNYLILTYLALNSVIEYGWEAERGLFITRLKEIKEIETPYSPT